ncbi:hypothetical protein C8R43DRAFT_942498 [Mycena crocata]|nr:hypothetical protein C8R43DRAFT_942498 [Mycena crocata]
MTFDPGNPTQCLLCTVHHTRLDDLNAFQAFFHQHANEAIHKNTRLFSSCARGEKPLVNRGKPNRMTASQKKIELRNATKKSIRTLFRRCPHIYFKCDEFPAVGGEEKATDYMGTSGCGDSNPHVKFIRFGSYMLHVWRVIVRILRICEEKNDWEGVEPQVAAMTMRKIPYATLPCTAHHASAEVKFIGCFANGEEVLPAALQPAAR